MRKRKLTACCATRTFDSLIQLEATQRESQQRLPVPQDGRLQLPAQAPLRHLGRQQVGKDAQRPCVFAERTGDAVCGGREAAAKRMVERDGRLGEGEERSPISFDGAQQRVAVHARLALEPRCEPQAHRDGILRGEGVGDDRDSGQTTCARAGTYVEDVDDRSAPCYQRSWCGVKPAGRQRWRGTIEPAARRGARGGRRGSWSAGS